MDEEDEDYGIFGEGLYGEEGYYVGESNKTWRAVHVMVLKLGDDGIAERVAVGKVFGGSLERGWGEKVWKEIVLG